VTGVVVFDEYAFVSGEAVAGQGLVAVSHQVDQVGEEVFVELLLPVGDALPLLLEQVEFPAQRHLDAGHLLDLLAEVLEAVCAVEHVDQRVLLLVVCELLVEGLVEHLLEEVLDPGLELLVVLRDVGHCLVQLDFGKENVFVEQLRVELVPQDLHELLQLN